MLFCFKVTAVPLVSTLISQAGIGIPESNEDMPRKCFTGREAMTKSLLWTLNIKTKETIWKENLWVIKWNGVILEGVEQHGKGRNYKEMANKGSGIWEVKWPAMTKKSPHAGDLIQFDGNDLYRFPSSAKE